MYICNNYAETCKVNKRNLNEHDCHVIEGRISIYISSHYNNTKGIPNSLYQQQQSKQVTKSIQSIMDDGLLNNCHPAIVKVSLRDKNYDETYTNTGMDDDGGRQQQQPRQLVDIYLIISGAGFSMMLFIVVVVTRYRYTTSIAQKDSDRSYGGSSGSNSNSNDRDDTDIYNESMGLSDLSNL